MRALVAIVASTVAIMVTASCITLKTAPVAVNCCCTGTADGGTPDGGGGGGDPDPGPVAGWLYTQGNQILNSDGSEWFGRGANLMDTRQCNACAYNPPNVSEVNRRLDELVSWGANFIRLDMESYANADGRVHWQNVLADPAYLADLQTIIAHAKTKPGLKVLLALWIDPTLDSRGWPTSGTADIFRTLAETFKNDEHVMFGISNEPTNNYDGADDATVWSRMNTVVQAIRAKEDELGTPHHIVAVQGTGGWARLLNYYITHPIPSDNVVYETHVYNPQADFNNLVTVPKQTLPVIIGEFGPVDGYMTITDTQALMDHANSLSVPWAAWTFHNRCPPNLIMETAGGCGIGMTLTPTQPFGVQVKAELASAPNALKPVPPLQAVQHKVQSALTPSPP